MKLLGKTLLVFGIFSLSGSFLLVSARAAMDDGNNAEDHVDYDHDDHLLNGKEPEGIMDPESKETGSDDGDDADEYLKELIYYDEVKVCAAYRKSLFRNVTLELQLVKLMNGIKCSLHMVCVYRFIYCLKVK